MREMLEAVKQALRRRCEEYGCRMLTIEEICEVLDSLCENQKEERNV